MHDFTPLPALLGGALIGLAATALLATHGKVAGISGMVGALLQARADDHPVRAAFVAGLLATGAVLAFVAPGAFGAGPVAKLPIVAAAGLLVGFGTRLGNGCTSGHGVCGVSRLSVRSLVATMTFMTTGALTVFVTRHLLATAGAP